MSGFGSICGRLNCAQKEETKAAEPALVFSFAAEGTGVGRRGGRRHERRRDALAPAPGRGPGCEHHAYPHPKAPPTSSVLSPRHSDIHVHPPRPGKSVLQQPYRARMNSRASLARAMESVHVLRQMARVDDRVGWTTSDENDSKVRTPS